MATSMKGAGTVNSIAAPGTSVFQGTINVDDESDDVLNVFDTNFTSANFTLGEWVQFTINTDDNSNSSISGVSALATGKPIPPITSSTTADITANMGQVVRITGAGTIASGNITINGGKVVVDGGAQIGPLPGGAAVSINVSGGIIVAKGGGSIVNGGIVINQGGSMKAVNGGSISGGGMGINQAGRIIAGNATGPGTISAVSGTLSIQGVVRGINVAEDGRSSFTA